MIRSVVRRVRRAACAGVLSVAAATTLVAVAAPQVAVAQSLEEQFERQADVEYHQLLQQAAAQHALAPDGNLDVERLRLVQRRILPFTYAINPRARDWKWEVNLIGSKQVNAFCMPGGKIAFFSAILTSLKLTDDEIAIVMGHEITHALREHGVEQAQKRMKGELLTRGGGALLSALFGLNPNIVDFGARGLNSVIQLRFSRGDESEADAIGLRLAAQAGYDPRAGLSLWRKMAQAARGTQPEWLSSHPANENRIANIERLLPQVLPLYAYTQRTTVQQLPPYRGSAAAAR